MAPRWLSQTETDVPTRDDWLTARERERAGRMRYTKRRNEFLLGRWTAKRAIARWLGHPDDAASLARLEIRNGSDGAPFAVAHDVAAPLTLSMTDRAGWAVCAVHRPDMRLGCDLELVEPRSAAFVRDYLTDVERNVVDSAPTADEHDLRANLFWSAKESALKVLRTGLRRDTRSVEVHLVHDGTADAWHPLRVRTEEGSVFFGWWQQFGAFLLSVVADVEIRPPTSMQQPPGLASGTPTHSWTDVPLVPPGVPAGRLVRAR
jgi:4'-phosphopantetheinyl transferase